MPTSTPLTIDLPADVQMKLDRLAVETRRSSTSLAREAIAGYVRHQWAIVEGIKQGMADVAAGRVVSHEEAMAQVKATIKAAETRRNALLASDGDSNPDQDPEKS